MTHATSAPVVGDSASLFTPPFSVQSSCVLSEDYFLTSQVLINDGDLIRPFLQADGTVEALVLSGGNLSWLHRDPVTTSGWSYIPLSMNPDMVVPGEVSDVAVGTDSQGNVMGVCVAPNEGEAGLSVPALPAGLRPVVRHLVLRSGRGQPDSGRVEPAPRGPGPGHR